MNLLRWISRRGILPAMLAAVTAATAAHAVPLLSGFGGPAGYGVGELASNDDGSTGSIDLTPAFVLGINFFSFRFTPPRGYYRALFVNNNGNVTFNGALGTFTPTTFPIADQPMIAAWWGDVDTRNRTISPDTRNRVYYVLEATGATRPEGGASTGRFIATWHYVGYFSNANDRLNDFQIILTNRSDIVAGDYDVELRYNQCQWTTGTASGGSGGLGGTAAQAGFDAGNRADFFALPGSQSPAVLNLCTTSNVVPPTPGLWRFNIRSGGVTVCGNGVREAGEECDDANTRPGDGCSANCRTELNPGATCTTNAQCRSQFCVDGVCCNAACNGQCEACNATPGTCTPVAGAPRSGRPACAGTGPCAGSCDGAARTACGFPGGGTECAAARCESATFTPPGVCNGMGACGAPASRMCAPYVCGVGACRADCRTDGDCTAGNFCNAAMQCVPRTPPGSMCTAGNQCASGNCVDGFCCNTACGGQCEACDVPGMQGTCALIAGAPHGARTACAGSAPCAGSCDGAARDRCAFPDAMVSCRAASCSMGVATAAAVCDGMGSCPAPRTTPCAPFTCATAACSTMCTMDSDCAEGSYCADGVCTPRLPPGAGCRINNACASGFCADGVCCDQACNGQCEACDVAKAMGNCTAVMGVPRGGRSACNGAGACGGTCDGTARVSCAYPPGTTACRAASCADGSATAAASCDGMGNCPAAVVATCAPYRCVDAACGTTCATDADCDGGTRCIAGRCEGPRNNGTGCGRDAECASGACAQGVCCNRACDGLCEACDADGTGGTCTPRPAGERPVVTADAGVRPPEGCLCNGAGMCVVPPALDAGTPDVGVITQDAGTDLGMDVGADLGPAPTYGFQGNGCGCRVGDGTSRPSGALVALGVAGLLLASRRRRRGLTVARSVGR